MSRFIQLTQQDLDRSFSRRAGETKLGEKVRLSAGDIAASLEASEARYVVIGIPEDIGVRANYGVGGTRSLWPQVLKSLLNVQNTDKLDGSQLLLLGAFDFTDLIDASAKKDVNGLRELVAVIDDEVYPVVEAIAASGKIPIAVGGGHNNAYPILKGCSRAAGRSMNCINLDAHSDYRRPEGRHSGNGFRYAKADGFLSRYAVIGLHENYNSAVVLSDMQSDKDIWSCFYEDIFLHRKFSFEAVLEDAVAHTAGAPLGIELDMDCIERMLSSAATPTGITPLMARQYVTRMGRCPDTAYLHITEGASTMDDGRNDPMTAKLATYLITDFIKANNSSLQR